MGGDETLMSCVNQDEQSLACWNDQENQTLASWADQENMTPNTAQSVEDRSSRSESLACWAEQENMTPNTAQSVDDKSSRSENLQSVSNTLQCNDTNKSRICEEGEYPLYGRNLLNSAIGKFIDRTYTCDYKLPEKDSVYKGDWYNKMVRFHVEYVPASKTLFITMPVQYMGPTNLNDGTSDAEDRDLQIGTMSAEIPQSFKDAHRDSIERVWSGKHQLHLKEICSSVNYDSGSCYGWTNISPVNVHVTLKEMNADMSCEAYKVFYLPTARYDEGSAAAEDNCTETCGLNTCCTNEYRDQAGPDSVIFSKTTFENGRDQETFAHEFGHQIGDDDQYAVDYIRADVQYNGETKNVCVYKKSVLNAYERTKYKRQYTLPKEKSLFNHGGVDYSAELKTFNGRRGFVLYANGVELTQEFPGLKSRKPDKIKDENGTHLVYFYDILKAEEEPGPRVYDFEKFIRDNGKIYHNYREYLVKKDNQSGFYYLVDNLTGEIKNEYLDGTYTSHFNMAKEQFGEQYALDNATMFNWRDVYSGKARWSGLDPTKYHLDDKDLFENEKNIMHSGGNDIAFHDYAPFKKGMAEAIQHDSNGNGYGNTPSQKAPNMEQDWEIK